VRTRGAARRGLSVRTRTTLAATAVVAVLLTAAGWVLVASMESALLRDRDDAARARAGDLADLASGGRLPSTVRGIGDDSIAQVIGEDGSVGASSRNIRGQDAVVALDDPRLLSGVHTVRARDDGEDVETYRSWAVAATAPDGGREVIVVGTSTESVSEVVAELRGLLLLGVPLTVLALALLTWLVVGRALQPVHAISAEVAEISAADLTRRVPEPSTGDEIARLAATMNAMLDRLATSARRQREFVADASHELQSPLARLRAQLDVALAHPATTDWDRLAHDLLVDAGELEALVRDLLFLAKDDEVAGRPTAPPVDLVDLDVVVTEEVARLRSTSRVPVDTTAVSAAPVQGSEADLGRLVRNLLENAARHATGRVAVSSASADGVVELVVQDDGPGIPPDQRDRVFERFVRLDGARSPGSGAGLGLAIVATVAARHHGTVSAADRDGGGTTVTVRLPAAAVRGPGAPGAPGATGATGS
jgi:signal transduction histidine kinase